MWKFISHNFCHQMQKAKMFNNLSSHATVFKYVWIDMEMTGLNLENDKMLEVACILTDSCLNKTIEGPHLIIHQPDEILNSMDEWCVEHHTKSGLVDACKKSEVRETDADSLLFDFISKHVSHKNGMIAGNSVYTDKLFLKKYLPKVNEYLHYRIIDVSTVKELCRSWFPQEYSNAPEKKVCHRALSDIRESIEELRYYKDSIFKPK